MKVSSVTHLDDKFEECDITTTNENFFVKASDAWVLIHNSPALIFGWRGDEFVLTDKAGFGAKGYDGMTTSGDAIESMIMARKMKDTSPQAVAARGKYARTIASLYPILKASVPKTFQGFAQGDLMWVGTPRVVDGAFEFKPNKVLYRVGTDTDLGQHIAHSRVGMVIHSVFASQQDEEPDAIRDVHKLGFSEDHGLVVVPHEIELEQTLKLNPSVKKQVEKIITSQGSDISKFLDPLSLADRNIKALPGLIKTFLAHKAGEGSNDFSRAGEEFLSWLASANSKASAKMQNSVLEWIQGHLDGYNAVWHVIKLLVDLKLDLKAQIDRQVGDIVYAELDNKPGHEGFVSVTPDGIIKLVHRAEFMKKKLDESVMLEQDAPRVAFTFARMNPPTLGHKMVVDKVSQAAQGGDYYIFLSQSQDPKKNPLDWNTKQHFAKLMMPRHRAHFAHGSEFANVKTPLLAADWLYSQGYRDMVMVVGSDRVDSMKDILNGWNSEEIRNKYHRDLVNIQVISAGDRDPDAEGVEGISASMVRALAQNNDFDGFKSAVGLDDASALAMYDAVRKGMKMGEPKDKKKIKEGLWNKMFGKSTPKLPRPSSFPQITRDVEKVADWVRQWVAYERQEGRNPADLFDPNQPQGSIWLTIHAGISEDMSKQVFKHLWNDPEIGPMIKNAPRYEPRAEVFAPGDMSYSSKGEYTYKTQDDDLGRILNTLVEDHAEDHSSGTIVMLRMAYDSAQRLSLWCQHHGIDCMDPHELHMTVLYSKAPMPHLQALDQTDIRISCKARAWKKLGESALVLDLDCPAADRLHQKFVEQGAQHSHPTFIAHTSVNYHCHSDQLPSEVPDMVLIFDRLEVEPVDPDYSKTSK